MLEKLVFVQGGKRVNFQNDDGENINGMNIHYYEEGSFLKDDTGFGLIPSKQWIKPEDFTDFTSGSGYYNMKLDIDMNGARPKIVVKGFDFVGKEKPKKLA